MQRDKVSSSPKSQDGPHQLESSPFRLLFWADQKADEIIKRKRFRYLKKDIQKFDRYTIKTSASISGVLHIGRLSDTIRSESVVRALKDRGYDCDFIWVAEDMDPLRKIPEGVPEKYEEYLGMPVTDVPDPWGCHASYAEHHVSRYLEVLDEFVSTDLVRFSMKEEYQKGNFRPYIKKILENLEGIKEIINKYRQNPLGYGWSPWTPICKGCGKIITPKVKGFENGIITYRCEDYDFEHHTAKGCGYEGENDPLKDYGKMMWKSEWAAQWARWGIVSEGAGKEYVVPSSAWWVNAEIAERVLEFPMPVPIFYEHLMINGEKMSASVGNVVYPHEWLEIASPELLRFFYNKKLMKTRSFSFKDLPNLYDDYDRHARVYFEKEEKVVNPKEESHMKRLYEISQSNGIERPLGVSFSHAAMVSQIFIDENAKVEGLKRSGHYDEMLHDEILKRLEYAKKWAIKYAPDESRVSLDVDVKKIKEELSKEQKAFLNEFSKWLERPRTPEEIHNQIYQIAKGLNLPFKEAFKATYLAILGTKRGPKAAPLIASLKRGWVIRRFGEVSR